MFYLICTYTAKKLAQPRRKSSTDASAPSARFSISVKGSVSSTSVLNWCAIFHLHPSEILLPFSNDFKKLNPGPGLNFNMQTFDESIYQFIWITGFQVTVTVTSNWKSLPNNFVQTCVERGLKPFGGVEIQPLKTNTFKIISLIEYLPWVALIMYELINMLWPCGVEVSEHLHSN